MDLQRDDLLSIYRWLVLTRKLEEQICDLWAQRNAPERQHASVGQEAIGVGACYGLRPSDVIIPSLRTRAAYLVKGVKPETILAVFLGKTTPQAKGKQTSHHLGDLSIGLMSGSGLVGDSIPVAVGAALAAKYTKSDRVVEVFFGDAASNRGDFHEALNLAAIWKAPVIFICENNQYAWSLHISKHMAIANIADRAASYGFPGVVVDGNDVLDVYHKTQAAVERARNGEGPTLLECKTYRWRGHSEREAMVYRPPEEVAAWMEKDPIKRLRTELIHQGILSDALITSIDKEIDDQLQNALEIADQAPLPDPNTLLDDVYAPFELGE